ncbi:MAG: hypothetical protein M4579_006899 [Chaenotheca gracillima]|nr:MAG: hypothetical protein M4579_006899 [Chaenotheca gracillima]
MFSHSFFLLLSSSVALTAAQTYSASFTEYGAADGLGSPNCQTASAACGFYTSPGYAAAASQNLFGAAPGEGAGPGCKKCFKLTGKTDSSGKALSGGGKSIIVKVNNLCPANGNPLCAMSSLTDTNKYGANVNFDLCVDSGAAGAFFPSGTALALGTAEVVSCSGWDGKNIS